MSDKYIGKVINNYEVLALGGKTDDGHQLYLVRCVRCGYERLARIATIKQRENIKCIHPQKRFDNSRIRVIYKNMLIRCYNEIDKSYRFYGGKGIAICDEWLSDPHSFELWAMENGYKDDLTIDRIDSNKDYSPDNCRWVTLSENTKWKSTTNHIEVNGIIDSGRGWSKRLGYGVNYVNNMIKQIGLTSTQSWIKEHLAV